MTQNWPSLETLLPHRWPMILLDRVLDYSEESILCELELREDSLFVENGRVRGVVSLEWMAQAVAAYVGETRRRQGLKPCFGFIVASRHLDLRQTEFAVGRRYQVRAELKWMDGSGGQFDCVVLEGDSVCSRGPLTVFQTEDGTLPI